jgi:hypothetical protein
MPICPTLEPVTSPISFGKWLKEIEKMDTLGVRS